jgi:aspartyl-tRNA(Asn)/glutamyl-tRNA(Gln) amidotransferase subunit A
VASRQIDRNQAPEWIEPTLRAMIENAQQVTPSRHGRRLARSAFYEQARRFFDTCDLLLTPQMPVGAWAADPGPGPQQGPAEIGGRPTPTMFHRLPFTYPFNLTGQPAATVPCGFTAEGLPVGLQIVGRWHADAAVLRAAACFEAVRPWAQSRPPLA